MKTRKDSLMGHFREIMLKMEVGEEWTYDTSNRNFLSLKSTFYMLKKADAEMLLKDFDGWFSEDHTLFFIKRTK